MRVQRVHLVNPTPFQGTVSPHAPGPGQRGQLWGDRMVIPGSAVPDVNVFKCLLSANHLPGQCESSYHLREGESSVWCVQHRRPPVRETIGCLSHTPDWGLTPQPRHAP